MRTIILTVMLTALAVFCWNSVKEKTASAEPIPGPVQKWTQQIEENSPSKTSGEYQDNQELSKKDRLLLEKKAEFIMLQEKHRMLLLIAIVVSTPVLLALVLFFLKKAPDCSGDSLVHAIGLVLVIEGTMFIAVSAITTEQLTAPIGILGAIAGYLFGSAKRKAMTKTG